ncbi:MAG TPA: ABC transporter ATP-binding protein [Casimicrobiaceae bacterium]|nr:ABC transporter ATP-binding protein [Casimicrobiaceae bacterium]
MIGDLARYARHLSGHGRTLAALFALGLAGAAVSLATPLLGMAFVDAVATHADYGAIPWIAAALVGLALADLAIGALAGRVHAGLSADVLNGLRARLFARCVDGPLDEVEAFRHGDLLARFGTDVPRIEALIVGGLLAALQGALFLAVAAAITFHLSPPLALWSFAGLGLALAATHAFRPAIERRTRRIREAMADQAHFLSERLSGLRAIRLHRTARDEAAALAAVQGRLKREVTGFQWLDSASSGVPGLALTLALAWIYVVGGRLIETGAITLGTFVAFVLYQGRLFAPAQGLLGLVRNLQQARASLERVAEVLGGEEVPLPATADRPRAPSPHAVELRGVTFAYRDKPPVLRDVDLAIAPGERVALFGASGAGKSTIVHLLFGLREPDAGTVEVGGRRARDGGVASIGYAGAEPFLLHASVEANLRYAAPGATREAIGHALAIAEAASFVAALPDGLDTVVGGRGLALSDGQRQRLGIARLVLQAPRVFVLDEALSGLDLGTERDVRRNLRAAFPDRAMLVISHRPVAPGDVDRVLLLRDGGLREVDARDLPALLGAQGERASPRAVEAAR